MRKRTIGGIVSAIVVAVLIGAVFIASSLMGSRVRQYLRSLHASVSQSPYIEWRLQSYDGGLFGATAAGELTLTAPSTGETTAIPIRHRISYFPVAGWALATIHSRPDLPPGPLLDALYTEDTDPLTVDSTIGMSGTFRARLKSPATKGERDFRQGKIDWGGMNAVVVREGDADQRYHYEIDLPRVAIRNDSSETPNLRIESLRTEGRLKERTFSNLPLGHFSLAADRVVLQSQPAGKVALKQFRLTTSSSADKGRISTTAQLTTKKLAAPTVSLSDVDISLSSERFAADLVKLFQKIGRRSGSGSIADRQVIQQTMAQADWGQIAAARPHIGFHLQADTEDGATSIVAKGDLANPLSSLNKVGLSDLAGLASASLEVSIPPKTLVALATRGEQMQRQREDGNRGDDQDGRTNGDDSKNNAAAESEPDARTVVVNQIRAARQNGIIVIKNGRFHFSASYDKGTVKMNGERRSTR